MIKNKWHFLLDRSVRRSVFFLLCQNILAFYFGIVICHFFIFSYHFMVYKLSEDNNENVIVKISNQS